jgi:hypothetical protein
MPKAASWRKTPKIMLDEHISDFGVVFFNITHRVIFWVIFLNFGRRYYTYAIYSYVYRCIDVK